MRNNVVGLICCCSCHMQLGGAGHVSLFCVTASSRKGLSNEYQPIACRSLHLTLHCPFFWRIWLKLSGIARNGQSRIPLFYFLRKIFLLSYLSFTFFQGFCRINTTFLFFNGFSYFLLSFCCCPAELESVEIFEISLSVLELCQKYFILFFENNS